MWSRRSFIRSAGALFMAGLLPREAHALDRAEAVFVSSLRQPDGTFAAALLNERGDMIRAIGLPGRGHDITQCPVTGRLVVFARRPGTFALVVGRAAGADEIVTSPENRHFYGHGAFSPDGRLLYTSENDYKAATGKIGIYDATDGFRRIGEWSSGGVGPHDILLSADGKYLCVANGGIETHPDYGRAKLNLATMRPNLAWIERQSGHIAARHALPEEFHQLSTRHLATGPGNAIWFACQYQGPVADRMPLLGSVAPDLDLTWTELPETDLADLRNYIGSVAASPDGERIALGSPAGNTLLIVDSQGHVLKKRRLEDVCGVAHAAGGFSFSTGAGQFGRATSDAIRHNVNFDNHLLALAG